MQRRAARHATRMEQLHRYGWTGAPRRWYEHQAERQRPTLRARRRLQKDVLALLRHARSRGQTTRQVADALGIALGTLQAWRRSWADLTDRLKPAVRGAPQYEATPEQRKEVHRWMDFYLPIMSESVLMELFPEIARRELMRMLMGRRALARQADGVRRGDCQLWWVDAGHVWAMDFTELDEPDAQGRRFALVVRDLASRCILATEICHAQDHTVVLAVLRRLLRAIDAPLVIKADNGSHFRCAEVEAMLHDRGIVALWSPPYYPRFNGAIEAGIGRWKDRLRILVDRDAHGWRANGDHAEGARLWANRDGEATKGVSPEARWAARQPIRPATRDHFQAVLAMHQERIAEVLSRKADIAQSAVESSQPNVITLNDAAHRRAVVTTLVETRAVLIRRRSVAQPIMDLQSA
jgi:transposase InsO family protein